MTTQQEINIAKAYIEKFSVLNPRIPVNRKAEPIGYVKYLKELLNASRNTI